MEGDGGGGERRSSGSRNMEANPGCRAAAPNRHVEQDQVGEQEGEGPAGGGGGGGGGGDGGHGAGGGGQEPPKEKIRFLYTNAQSLPNKVSELEAVATDLSPDVILLCETWCNNATNSAGLQIEGYTLQQDLRRDRTDTANGIGGGLLVYARNGLVVLPCDQESDFNQYCKFSLVNGSETFYVYLIYRPPSAGQSSKDKLSELLKEANKNSLFVGDFNLPGIDWVNGVANGGDEGFVQALHENLFSQLVEFPTHTKGNCLDLIVSNIPERIGNISEVGRLGKSDHCIIQFELAVSHKIVKEKIKTKNWKRADWDRINIELEATVWPTTEDQTTAEEA